MKPRDASLFQDPHRAWEPYQPSPEVPWDAARAAHLHRRAGFGATWGQLQRDVSEGIEPSLRRVLDGESQGPGAQSAADFDETVEAMRQSFVRRPAMARVALIWIYRLIHSPHPLAEVMTLAWHSHYATSQAKVDSPERMLDQNLVFRKNWRAPISTLHKAILSDAAMLRWLDGLDSTKTTPNENLAREFLELFALGVGNYDEHDVRETARAFTGWRQTNYSPLAAAMEADDHDPGSKTILGQTGNWGQDDVVRIACGRPAAAEHVARRLYRTFIADVEEPSRELIAPLADAMRLNDDVDVARGIELILRSRLFQSDECRGKSVKSPATLAVGAIRACEAFHPPVDPDALEIHLTRMGQRLFYPPSVAGWRGGLGWLSGSTVLARANFAAWLTGPSSGLSPRHFQDLADRYGWTSPEARLSAFETLLLAAPIGSDSREQLRNLTDPAQVVRTLLSIPEGQAG
ncbi:MAG: DUF1800 domain-containing protein [Paludisphaera borealis]|uniref:DUF1800 domain-containing protein n=1 Tax=Paludisphaera borealis TaxID=1387353 RepID=UPI002840FEE4|nr:DUF1800 domain-containing protein [Paludisphaera borealis]MDR3620023.1 DUF1800 domain-containing protein [Paludisphaera borealis]